MRIAFTTFLSSEALALMGIRCIGEWKHYAVERFRGILNLTVAGAENKIGDSGLGKGTAQDRLER